MSPGQWDLGRFLSPERKGARSAFKSRVCAVQKRQGEAEKRKGACGRSAGWEALSGREGVVMAGSSLSRKGDEGRWRRVG